MEHGELEMVPFPANLESMLVLFPNGYSANMINDILLTHEIISA